MKIGRNSLQASVFRSIEKCANIWLVAPVMVSRRWCATTTVRGAYGGYHTQAFQADKIPQSFDCLMCSIDVQERSSGVIRRYPKAGVLYWIICLTAWQDYTL
ncbi:hypothetical protein [Halioxenophilus aromaticivorans]|uniref:hypothetical protein n=1 Tax=Halioxenophilus aromaticivorans TaxID=1306992 RepID=UPI0031E4E878